MRQATRRTVGRCPDSLQVSGAPLFDIRVGKVRSGAGFCHQSAVRSRCSSGPAEADWGISLTQPGASGAMLAVMTMFLSNREVRPTGYEVCEFLEAPALVPAVASPSETRGDDEQAED